MTPSRLRQTGFSLIELMVVIAILAVLMSMAMPVVTIASRAAKRSATLAVLTKTEAALNLFRTDMRVFPHQLDYPTNGATAPFLATDFVNRLAYQVGTSIATNDADKIRADIGAAEAAYRYDIVLETLPESTWGGYKIDWTASQATAGPLAINATNILWERLGSGGNTIHIWGQGDPKTMDGNAKRDANNVPTAMMVNRLFQERARRALLGGMITITGTKAFLPLVNGAYPPRAYPDCQYDHRADRVLLLPASATKPGWAVNYLGTDLEPRFRLGDAIVDAWKRPLIYLHQLTPEINQGTYLPGPPGNVVPFDTRWYGMRCRPLLPSDMTLTPHTEHSLDGRIRLSATDCGWGEPTPVDAIYFPTANRLMDSDIRYYAAPGFERDFELWSSGVDGRFCWRRSDASNRDNLAARRYGKGLE